MHNWILSTTLTSKPYSKGFWIFRTFSGCNVRPRVMANQMKWYKRIQRSKKHIDMYKIKISG
ncbi:hypothetical protein LguiB_001207 [Lonicera macranthoides]